MNNKNGFTLAEVLITLGIIGVVAAMTMPVLITNIRNTELQSRFKKTTAELQAALQKVQFDEGQTIYGNYTGNGNNIAKIIVKQFKAPATYHFNPSELRNNKLNGRDLIYKHYNGSDFSGWALDDGTIIVNDNFFIFVNNDGYSLTGYRIYIDTNGYKKPNKEGYDLFKFCLKPNDRLDYNCDEYTQKAFTEKDYFKNLPR